MRKYGGAIGVILLVMSTSLACAEAPANTKTITVNIFDDVIPEIDPSNSVNDIEVHLANQDTNTGVEGFWSFTGLAQNPNFKYQQTVTESIDNVPASVVFYNEGSNPSYLWFEVPNLVASPFKYLCSVDGTISTTTTEFKVLISAVPDVYDFEPTCKISAMN